MNICHPLQKAGVNFIGGKYALLKNPEKGCSEKHKINMQTVQETSQTVVTCA